MSWKIAGVVSPTKILKNFHLSSLMGFSMPFIINHDGTKAVPLIENERITGIVTYDDDEDRMLATTTRNTGATMFEIGQPALYGFKTHAHVPANIAIRAVLMPELRNWLAHGKQDADDNVIAQAETFCEHRVPQELRQQYAYVDLHIERQSNRHLN